MGLAEADHVSQLNLPPGFRFYPTDEELLVHYLCPKVAGQDLGLQVIGEVDLYKFDPWVLPSKALFGEKEWYFFSPRDRKYPNGSRPNRVAETGYWKATGTDKVITAAGRSVGIKKSLVFYVGKAPKGAKTNWIMHEYRIFETARKKGSRRLDDWVLCRIYNKNSGEQVSVSAKEPSTGCSSPSSYLDDALDSLPDMNERLSSAPRMNSLKPERRTPKDLGIGNDDSVNQRTELGHNGQTQIPISDFCFPTMPPPICQVESPSEILGSSIEDEVESTFGSKDVDNSFFFQEGKSGLTQLPSLSQWFDPFTNSVYSSSFPCRQLQ